jgi:hypothetical protein
MEDIETDAVGPPIPEGLTELVPVIAVLATTATPARAVPTLALPVTPNPEDDTLPPTPMPVNVSVPAIPST